MSLRSSLSGYRSTPKIALGRVPLAFLIYSLPVFFFFYCFHFFSPASPSADSPRCIIRSLASSLIPRRTLNRSALDSDSWNSHYLLLGKRFALVMTATPPPSADLARHRHEDERLTTTTTEKRPLHMHCTTFILFYLCACARRCCWALALGWASIIDARFSHTHSRTSAHSHSPPSKVIIPPCVLVRGRRRVFFFLFCYKKRKTFDERHVCFLLLSKEEKTSGNGCICCLLFF